MPVELLAIWGVFLVTTCACFLIGLNIAGYFKLEPHEKLSISFGIGFSILFLLELLIQWNYFLGAGVFVGLLAHSIWRFIKKTSGYKFGKDEHSLIFFFFTIIILQFSTLIFSSFLSGDWEFHAYNFVQEIIKGNLFPDKNRTAAWSFPIAFFLQLYRLSVSEIWVAQISSIYWNMCFIFPMYNIAAKVFNRKVAWGTVFLIGFSPYFWQEAVFLWGKSFAIYCVLISFYFLFYKGNYYISGFFALLAFYTHTSFIIFFGINLLILLVNKDLFKKRYLPHYLIVFGGVGLYLFLNSMFAVGNGPPMAMLVYPFIVNYPAEDYLNGLKTLDQVWQEFLDASIFTIVFWRAVSFIFTAIPAWLVLAIYRIFIPDVTVPVMTSTDSLVFYYRVSIYGAIGTIAILLLIPLIFDWIRHKYPIKREIALSVLLPVIVIVCYIGWKNYGLWSQGSQVAYPFLAMVVVDYLFKKPWKKWVKAIPFVTIVIEYVLMITLSASNTSYYAVRGTLVLNTVTVFASDWIWNVPWLIVSFGFILCSYYIYQRKGKLIFSFQDLFTRNKQKIEPNGPK